MKPVYLCGPIQNRSDMDCVAWRLKATVLLAPIPTLDPVAARDCRGRELDEGMACYIVDGDVADISNAACLLVMFDRPSVGTSMEIRAAYQQFGIPVFTIDVSGAPRSPWLIYHTTQFFDSLEAACDHILKHYREQSLDGKWTCECRPNAAIDECLGGQDCKAVWQPA